MKPPVTESIPQIGQQFDYDAGIKSVQKNLAQKNASSHWPEAWM